MFLDALLLLSGSVSAVGALTGQAVNGAGTILSANTIDAAPLALGGNQPGDIGSGEDLNVAFSVLTAPTVGTSVQFQVIQADDAALTANVEVISSSDAVPIAKLPAGTVIKLGINPAPGAARRYIGARYINVGAIATCSISAAVVKDVQGKNTAFKSGYSIL
jgi:hypothetical protein